METSDDGPDARSWRAHQKIVTVFFVASFSFLGTFAASIIAPGRNQIEKELHVSRTVSVLTFSLFNLGLAWGCVLSSPLSENHGRRVVYVIAMPLLLIFVMGCGFSNDLPSLLICRLLGGLAGSPGVTLASATISDMYEPGRARGVALFCYYSMPWLGSVLGPLIGAVVVAYKDWQWTQWVFLFIAVPIVSAGLVFLKETKKSALEARAADNRSLRDRFKPGNLIHQIGKAGKAYKAVPHFMRTSLARPLRLLFTELMVGLVCLYAGFNFGLIYALVVVFPDIFKDTYGFDTVQLGLAFLGLIVGCIVGPASLILDNEVVVRQASSSSPSSKDQESQSPPVKPPPESRLHGALLGSVLLPIGLIWFAWTARSTISYLSPIFASVLITLGSLTIYVSTAAYIIDVYGPQYGASVTGATSISRYTLATVIPLFVLQMYDGLGTAWATSLLALCAFLMMPIPFCFFYWGPQLRKRCKFDTEQ